MPLPRPATRRLRVVVATVALALAGSALAAAPASAAPKSGTKAVALGDSFASGEGLAPYRAGTDTTTNTCHRSFDAYPELLDEGRRPAVRTIRSAACSGAVTGAVVADLPGDRAPTPQIAALSRRTKTVTLTIGGNDVGFAPVLRDCTYTPVPALQGVVTGRPGCRDRNDDFVTTATARLAGATSAPGSPSLAQVLDAIQDRAPKAKIYVTGYPRLFGLTGFHPTLGCQVGAFPGVDGSAGAPLYVTGADVHWIRSKAGALNAALRTGVEQAQRAGVRATYVDVAETFTSHNVCSSGTPWVNGVVLPTTSPSDALASFHPNELGQQAYAAAVASAIRDHRSRS